MNHAKRQKRSIMVDKRREIQNAAIDVFAKRGYNTASIKDIADKAGVATGTVYLYYKNKDDLLLQAMKYMLDSCLHDIRNRVVGITSPLDKIYAFYMMHMEMFTKRPSMARFLIVELRQSEEFYKKHPTYNPYEHYVEYVVELLNQAIEEGLIKPFNPHTIAYSVIGFMDSLLTHWLRNPSEVNLEQTSGEFREIIQYGIRTR
jgi:TetR/AcrR family transcriptional regulator, fatty acid metabolism regulator protein